MISRRRTAGDRQPTAAERQPFRHQPQAPHGCDVGEVEVVDHEQGRGALARPLELVEDPLQRHELGAGVDRHPYRRADQRPAIRRLDGVEERTQGSRVLGMPRRDRRRNTPRRPASASRWSSSALLPMPASPTMIKVPPDPDATPSSHRVIDPISTSRPRRRPTCRPSDGRDSTAPSADVQCCGHFHRYDCPR